MRLRWRWSLAFELGLLLVLQVLLLVAVYSNLLPTYLWNGIQEAAKVYLETEARQIEKRLNERPDAPLPRGGAIEAYLGVDALPPKIHALFDDRQQFRNQALYMSRESIEGEDDSYAVNLLAYELADGRQLFMIFRVRGSVLERPGGAFEQFEEYLDFTNYLGIAFLTLWGVITALLIHRIAKRTRRISRWTDALSETERDREQPKFGYREFDEIGDKLGGAFDRVSAALNRERDFVRNASHELRTPITVIQANVDLLKARAEIEDEAVARIGRASHKMQALVETLLWLGRESSPMLDAKPVDLAAIVKAIIDEHHYLLRGKPIEIACDLRAASIELQPEAANIVIGNLIRNAFQHTSSGVVRISNDNASVTVENTESGPNLSDPDGLGLTLVTKTTERMGWSFSVEKTSLGRKSTVVFIPHENGYGNTRLDQKDESESVDFPVRAGQETLGGR